jgi:SAM-dependent methyltransferase
MRVEMHHSLEINAMAMPSHDQCCTICASKDYEVIVTSEIAALKIYKVLCRECGLIYTRPMPTFEEYKEYFYNARINEAKAKIHLRRIYRSALRSIPRYNRVKALLKHCNDVLDASAGTGEFVALLKMKGKNATGLSFYESQVNYAAAEYGVTLECGLIEEVDFPKNSLDLILDHHSLHLQYNPRLVLTMYHKMLRDGGYINIEVPNIEAEQLTSSQKLRAKHLYAFNLHSLLTLGRQHGFEVYNTIIIPGSQHINTIWRKGAVLTVPSAKSIRNYLEVRNAVKGYRRLHYLFSSSTYKKIFHKIEKYLRERHAAKQFKCGQEIIQHLFGGIR